MYGDPVGLGHDSPKSPSWTPPGVVSIPADPRARADDGLQTTGGGVSRRGERAIDVDRFVSASARDDDGGRWRSVRAVGGFARGRSIEIETSDDARRARDRCARVGVGNGTGDAS
jgi:hypothetical protein